MMVHSDPAPALPLPPDGVVRSRVSTWAFVAGGGAAMAALFVVRLTYFLFLDLAEGHAGYVPHRVFQEITGAATAALLLPGVVWVVRRVPLAPGNWRRGLVASALAFVAFTLAHTLTMTAVRTALAPTLGLDGYGFAFVGSRYAYEAANDVLPGVALLAGVALAETLLAQRERARRATELERVLLQAELQSLRLQLQPHFLFNALNTISSTMYDDPAAADALLGQLADLLRTSLRTTHTHEVAVRDEAALLAQYLGLMRARFGDRLAVDVHIADDAAELFIPSMLLQPLVENAVQHGGVTRTGRGRVTVAVRTVPASAGGGRTIELRVHDDGPGVAGGRDPLVGGTGLSATARRLTLLYGDAHSLVARNAAECGFEVVLRIPARRAPSHASAGPRGVPAAAATRTAA